MLIRSVPWFVFFALATGTSVSNAQVPADSLHRGERVQYELSGPVDGVPEESEARFDSLTAVAVVVRNVQELEFTGPVDLPKALIEDFEVARGTKDLRWLGLGLGGFLGVAAGVSYSQSASEGEVLFALAAPVLGAAAGGIVGFLVGKLITGPRWQDVEFD